MDKRESDFLPYDLLIEILSRLPGKPLMRFKCVSKRWFSLITDPIFAELHSTRSYNRKDGGIFVIPTSASDNCLMCIIDMNKEPLERVSVLEPSIPYQSDSNTNIVNGLICYYHHTYEKRLIYLYNLTTRETISLPLTQVEDRLKASSDRFSRTCLLGFDPINKEYKVLHFYSQGFNRKIECQVFTIGCQKKMWRPLELSHIQGFSNYTCKDAFCVDGVLYWTGPDVMILFNVGLEKFKVVWFPGKYLSQSALVKIQDGLFLIALSFQSHSIIDIVWWRYEEDKDTGEPKWTKEVVTCGDPKWKVKYVNHLGQIFSARSPHLDCPIIDYYDIATGKHSEFQVNNPQGILCRVSSFREITQVIDNIMPLHLASGCY